MPAFHDVFGSEIGVGSWVAYPGAQGSGGAYLSIGLVVELRTVPHTHCHTIRVRPYGRFSGSVLEPFKNLTTRAFWRDLGFATTILVPHTAFMDEATRKPMEDFYRSVIGSVEPPKPWWEKPEVLDEVIKAQDELEPPKGKWPRVQNLAWAPGYE